MVTSCRAAANVNKRKRAGWKMGTAAVIHLKSVKFAWSLNSSKSQMPWMPCQVTKGQHWAGKLSRKNQESGILGSDSDSDSKSYRFIIRFRLYNKSYSVRFIFQSQLQSEIRMFCLLITAVCQVLKHGQTFKLKTMSISIRQVAVSSCRFPAVDGYSSHGQELKPNGWVSWTETWVWC